MDGIESLLLKWDDMDNKGKAIVLVIGFGAVAFSLDQVLSFIIKWIVPYIPQNWTISAPYFILFLFKYLFVIFFYTLITILLINRAQVKAEKGWADLCGRLYRQIRQDHSNIQNMVWKSNREQNRLMFRDELDQLMYDAEYMLEDKEKRKN